MSTLCVVSGMKRAPRKQKRRVVCFKTSDVTGCGPRLPRSGEVPAVVWWTVVLATSDRGELSGARALSSAARQLSCCCCNSLTPRPHLANTPGLLSCATTEIPLESPSNSPFSNYQGPSYRRAIARQCVLKPPKIHDVRRLCRH